MLQSAVGPLKKLSPYSSIRGKPYRAQETVEVAGFDIRKLVNCLAIRRLHPHLPVQEGFVVVGGDPAFSLFTICERNDILSL